MSLTKTDLIVGVITVTVGVCLSVVVGFFASPVAGLITSFLSAIFGLFIDIRLNQEAIRRSEREREVAQAEAETRLQSRLEADRARQAELEARLQDVLRRIQLPLVANYSQLREDPCLLFQKVAIEKYAEVESFFAALVNDRFELDSLPRVAEILEFLFCDVEMIREIHATSYGELSEWREHDSWWAKNYARIHESAVKRGVKLQRIFILQSEDEKETGRDVFERQVALNVTVKLTSEKNVSTRDVSLIKNAIIFYNRRREPVYCLWAFHTSEGHFEKAVIHRDQRQIKTTVDVYKRIDGVAIAYKARHIETPALYDPLPKKG